VRIWSIKAHGWDPRSTPATKWGEEQPPLSSPSLPVGTKFNTKPNNGMKLP